MMAHLGVTLSLCTTSVGQTVMGGISMAKTVKYRFFSPAHFAFYYCLRKLILMQKEHYNAVCFLIIIWFVNIYFAIRQQIIFNL